MSRRRRRGWILVAVLVAFINLPILHSTFTNWRIDRSGVQLTVDLADDSTQSSDGESHYWLGFRFPEDIDPDQNLWAVEVDEETYDAAVASGTVEVQVLEDNPAAFNVEGAVSSPVGLITTLVADGILLVILLLAWRFGRRSRPEPFRLAAIGDVERCPPGGVIEEVEGGLYLVRGDVVSIADDEVVLDAGEREVVVVLDGHSNPVGYQQSAQVRGRVVE